MNTPAKISRSAELAALAMATDANGRVDLTAFEAHRLILQHESIDGLDAKGLVSSITASPAYQSTAGREQVRPLIDAINARLPEASRRHLAKALDEADVGESRLQRLTEDYLQKPLSRAYTQGSQAVRSALDWTDREISDNLAASQRWAQRLESGSGSDNPWLEKAAAQLARRIGGTVQQSYGEMKGASGQALSILGDTVDLVKLAHRFSTDADFRNMLLGAASVYAIQAAQDPEKPINDIRNAAVDAFNEWSRGLEKAQDEGKEREYLGKAQGAIGLELAASIVPISKVAKFGKLARAVDSTGELADGRTAARATGELAEELRELSREAAQVQARGGMEKSAADAFFAGLAGVKRSQGELRELVDGLRKSGDLDGLLASGALAPKELGYLARRDVSIFDGEVSFNQALNAYVGKRSLSELRRKEVGDIGEVLLAHDLARKGYRDLVPIQNNSGHGNDLVGINPVSGRWEVIEIKASVHDMAREQFGEPFPKVATRLERAVEGAGHWDPKNVWEEQAAQIADRIRNETLIPDSPNKLDIDPKWAQVNISRDPATGEMKAAMEVSDWLSPAMRKSKETLDVDNSLPSPQAAAPALPAGFAPALNVGNDMREPEHPGHAAYAKALEAVKRMEFNQNIVSGEHTEILAARLAAEAAEHKQGITHVEMGRDNQIRVIERHYAFDEGKQFSISGAGAISESIQHSSSRWLEATSPHYSAEQPVASRSEAQSLALARLNPADQAMFSAIRGRTPAHIGDDTVAHAMLEAKRNGIDDASRIENVVLHGQKLHVLGTTPGFRAAVNVTANTPELAQSVEANDTLNRERQQQIAQAQQQEQERAQNQGRGLSLG